MKDYRHEEKRPNNPPAGLATYDRTLASRKIYNHDPHLDPQLQWAGKAERLSFDVDNVALRIHERISTAAIVRATHEPPWSLSDGYRNCGIMYLAIATRETAS